MDSTVNTIQSTLQRLLTKQTPPLQIRTHTPTNFEVAGTKPAIQGKQQVDGYYFASVVPKPKDVRLYFFPIYTHPGAYYDLSPELRKCLKGKSCFHFKKLTPDLEREINAMICRGIDLYKKEDLI